MAEAETGKADPGHTWRLDFIPCAVGICNSCKQERYITNLLLKYYTDALAENGRGKGKSGNKKMTWEALEMRKDGDLAKHGSRRD